MLTAPLLKGLRIMLFSNALNAGKLLLIILGGSVYFLGLGWLVTGPMLYGRLVVKERRNPFIEKIPLIFMTGLILNYGLALLFKTLTLGLPIQGCLALVGFIFLLLSLFKQRKANRGSNLYVLKWLGIAAVLLFTISPILAVPIANGDARTMWFFYAKMIFYAGEIGPLAGWTHPSVSISHVDYPIFVPMLAAQVMHIIGYWNEYLPKISIFFMYVPAIFWLFSFAKRSISFFFLILLIPFSFYPWIWEGTMDGLLAAYLAISLLVFGRYIQFGQKLDLLSAFGCLFAALSIKNEGALAFLAGAAAIFLVTLKSYGIKAITKRFSWKYLIGIFIGVFPFLLWAVYLRIWNVQNDLQIGTIDSIKRIGVRILNGSIFQITQSFIENLGPALILFGVIYLYMKVNKISFTKYSIAALYAAILYFFGMFTIYLLTPHDLTWHLDHSIFRTTLPINGLLYIVSFFNLRTIEDLNQAGKLLTEDQSSSSK